MHKANISRGLREYWFRKKAYAAYANGTASAEQKAFVEHEQKVQIVLVFIAIAIFLAIGAWKLYSSS